jgi:hypothetical protein
VHDERFDQGRRKHIEVGGGGGGIWGKGYLTLTHISKKDTLYLKGKEHFLRDFEELGEGALWLSIPLDSYAPDFYCVITSILKVHGCVWITYVEYS